MAATAPQPQYALQPEQVALSTPQAVDPPGTDLPQPEQRVPHIDERALRFATRPDGSYVYDWDGPYDPRNPFNWSLTRKWIITFAALLVSINFGLPAGSYSSGNGQMSDRWNVTNPVFPHHNQTWPYGEKDIAARQNGTIPWKTDQVSPFVDRNLLTNESMVLQHSKLSSSVFPRLYWATASWNIGAALFPLVFVPLTESTGRMPGYFGAYIFFLIFLVPCALAPNFATMVVSRFFGGGASSVAGNIVGGTISDIWEGPRARSLPMSLFGTASVIGVALGPVLGAAITMKPYMWRHESGTYESFRWIYWIQLIYNAVLLIPFWFILTETRGDVILAREAKAYRSRTGLEVWADEERNEESIATKLTVSFCRPVRMLFTEIAVASFTLWVSFAWGILFLFTSSVVQTMTKSYNYEPFRIALFILGISVGALIGTILNPLQDWLYFRSASGSPDGQPIPEARIYSAIPGSLIFAAGLLWYGYTTSTRGQTEKIDQSILHWIWPTMAIVLVGMGIYSIYLGTVNYLMDAYERYAGSALSAASLGRNLFGALLPLASPVMYYRIGFFWASGTLAIIALCLTIAPIILLWQGREIRKRSPFMKESRFIPPAARPGNGGVEQKEKKLAGV